MSSQADFFEFLAPPLEAAEIIFDDYNSPRECEVCGKLFTHTECGDKRFCSIGCGDQFLRAEREEAKTQ